MTPDDLAAIRARAEAATEGPWAWASHTTVDGDEWAVFDPADHALASNRDGWSPDAEFIAHARTDVPALLAEVDRRGEQMELLREERDDLARTVAAENSHRDDADECAVCTHLQNEQTLRFHDEADAELHRLRAERDALATEVDRLTRLLGSHADGHRCTCTMLTPGSLSSGPPEWEQDPWCPTHPDVGQIKAEYEQLRAGEEPRAVIPPIAPCTCLTQRTRAEKAEAERDKAREECGHQRAMRQFVSDERDRFVQETIVLRAERDTFAAERDQLREQMRSLADTAEGLAATVDRVEDLAEQAEWVPIYAGGGNLVTRRQMVPAEDLTAAMNSPTDELPRGVPAVEHVAAAYGLTIEQVHEIARTTREAREQP